jgi:hypothetical protein
MAMKKATKIGTFRKVKYLMEESSFSYGVS